MTAARPIARPPTAAELRARTAEREAEEERQYRARYGAALEAVGMLRRRGYVVHNVDAGTFRVGNALKTTEEVIALGEREARLAGLAAPVRSVEETASGLKVGQSVPLAPRPTKKTAAPRPRATSATPRALSGAAATAKAKAAEHSTDLGIKPRVVWLDLGLLVVDSSYQRALNRDSNTHINRILRAFNWNCYQPIVVTERADGHYAVIDGQHRLEAARKHPLIDSLPCYIIDAPDVARQAAIFVEVNSARKALTSWQKFNASLAAGDASAVILAKLCDELGVTIMRAPPGRNRLPARSLMGPMVCQRLIARHGAGPVGEALRAIDATHGNRPGAFRSALIDAVTRIAAAPGYSRDALRRALAATPLEQFLGDVVTRAKGDSGSFAVAGAALLRQRMTSATT